MRDKHLDRLIERAGSKYTLVVAVAKRAQQIREGAVPTVEMRSNNPVTVSLAEIATSEVLVNPEELVAVKPQAEEAAPEVAAGLDDDDLDLFADMDLDGEDLADEEDDAADDDDDEDL
ncbi:MAG: DNA-directed RNA polymerase subunit omega [Armatimonadia bacterium]|nr:DNA-directed RNA polymerase subunit omega [Armatimonadia bacterium]